MSRRILVLVAAAALTLAACGGGDDGGGSGESDEGGTEGGTAATTLTVEAVDFAFEPSEIEVEPGAEVAVSFENTGDAPHTMTAQDVGLDIEADPGASAEGTFTAPESGTVEFVCKIHPDMKGTITTGTAAGGGGGGENENENEDEGGGGVRDY